MSARGRDRRPVAEPRRGLLSGMSAPPMDSMPKIRTAFTRGLAATWSSPLIVGSLLAWLLVEWILVVALGYPGPFALLAHISAPTPLSTLTDLTLSTGILGIQRGLVFVFATAAVHALWFSLLTGMVVDAVESGSATRWGAIRGLRALPVVFALRVIGVAVVFAADILGALGGGSLAPLLQDRRAGDCHVGIRVRADHRRHRAPPIHRLPGAVGAGREDARLRQPDVRGDLHRPGLRHLPRAGRPRDPPGGQPRCGCVGLRRPDEPVARRDRGSVGVSLPGGRGRGARRAQATDARSRGADRSRRRR